MGAARDLVREGRVAVGRLPQPAGVVEVWPVRLEATRAELLRCARLLSADESERAARFRFERDREAFVLARAALRVLLGAYLGRAPETLAFDYGAGGKPHLAGEPALRFNVSHSGGIALIAATRECELGVDVEALRRIEELEGIAARFFCAEERNDLMSLPPAQRDEAFLRCWTRKEAFVKASGEGLATPLDSFRVTLRPADPARLVHVGGDVAQARRWIVRDLPFAEGYAAALAYRDGPPDLALMELADVASLIARFA